MPISEQTRAALEMRLPPAEETRARARRYMLAADLQTAAFAKLFGYSAVALSAFLRGTYTTSARIGRTDLLVREAIESYIARHPLDTASTGGDTETLYETENVAQIRHWFDHCHSNRALAFIYGPPGSQKTFVLQHLIAQFNRRVLGQDARHRAYYVRASIEIRPRDLLRKICAECGADPGITLQSCMSSLRHHLRHTQTVVVLDEAQHCGIPALEALRELHDVEPRLGILLAGSHGLKQFFDQRAAELEQWNSRLDAGVELAGVTEATARAIFRAECPELDVDQVAAFIAGSLVPDPYSRERGKSYLSMRRVFKAIAAVHAHRQTSLPESSEVLQ